MTIRDLLPTFTNEAADLEDQEEHYIRNPEDSPEKPFDDRSTVKKLLCKLTSKGRSTSSRRKSGRPRLGIGRRTARTCSEPPENTISFCDFRDLYDRLGNGNTSERTGSNAD